MAEVDASLAGRSCPAPTKGAILVPIPKALVARMGLDRIREYLARLDAEMEYLAASGGGQLQTALDVQPKARGGGVGDVFTAPRRKL